MTGLKSGGEIEGGAREWRIIYPGARACNGGGGILGGKNERLKKTKRRGKGVKLKKGGGRFTGKCGGAHLCRKKTLFSSSLFFFENGFLSLSFLLRRRSVSEDFLWRMRTRRRRRKTQVGSESGKKYGIRQKRVDIT